MLSNTSKKYIATNDATPIGGAKEYQGLSSRIPTFDDLLQRGLNSPLNTSIEHKNVTRYDVPTLLFKVDNSLFLCLYDMLSKSDSPQKLCSKACRHLFHHYSHKLVNKILARMIREGRFRHKRLKRLRTKKNVRGTLAKIVLAMIDDQTIEHEAGSS